MNMTISASNYFNANLQSGRVIDTEEKTAGAGKTQQSAVSASLDQINLGEDGVAVNQVDRMQGSEKGTLQKRDAAPRRGGEAAPRTDTVEISEEGRAASARPAAEQAGTAAAAAQAETEAETDTDDLSEYTDAELKQMYYAGEITLQEYEDETGESL